MLVHVSRLRAWQHELKLLVENVFDFYRRGIEMKIASVLEEFRQTFEEDQDNYKSYTSISSQILNSRLAAIDGQIQVHDWEDVKQHLYEAASRIVVKEINMGSADALNYYDHPNGLSVIAVGGNKLSRGLTLEGLSVSYYLRSSRMYDSLMQMGRWFGYRPGYVDLCRLFTSRQLNEWFCHITHASEELRNEFDYMSDTIGATPEQYALKVRTHPGVLQISASNKIRRATTVTVSWAGRLVESYEFQKKAEVFTANLQAAVNFINQLTGQAEIRKDNFLWFDVAVDKIKSLLQNFRLSENLKSADPSNLLRFINLQIANNELTEWRVALMSKKKAVFRYEIHKGEEVLDIGLFNRKQDDRNLSNENYYIQRSHIISPDDESIDLTEEERTIAWNRTVEKWKRDGQPKHISGEVIRNEIRSPQKPLLLIYFLNPEEAGIEYDNNPIVGYAISFPASRYNAAVSYAVHEQLLQIFNQEDSLEEEEEDED